MAWRATRDGMSSYPGNPNLCERCIGDKRPERGFLLADTGRCGKCGEIDEVWDLEHLSELAAQGRAVYVPDGFTRIERPIRDSHMGDRYYLPAAQVQELSTLLADAETSAPNLVAEVRRLIFATEIPDDMADEIERQRDNAETGLSI